MVGNDAVVVGTVADDAVVDKEIVRIVAADIVVEEDRSLVEAAAWSLVADWKEKVPVESVAASVS